MTSPALLTHTTRTRRRGVSVTCILEQEYLSRYGCIPSGTAWRQEPWCAEVLRVLAGAVLLEPETVTRTGGSA